MVSPGTLVNTGSAGSVPGKRFNTKSGKPRI